MTKIEQLKDWIQSSDNIVFFGGAGVSTESGIPDFRGTNGLLTRLRHQRTQCYLTTESSL